MGDKKGALRSLPLSPDTHVSSKGEEEEEEDRKGWEEGRPTSNNSMPLPLPLLPLPLPLLPLPLLLLLLLLLLLWIERVCKAVER